MCLESSFQSDLETTVSFLFEKSYGLQLINQVVQYFPDHCNMLRPLKKRSDNWV